MTNVCVGFPLEFLYGHKCFVEYDEARHEDYIPLNISYLGSTMKCIQFQTSFGNSPSGDRLKHIHHHVWHRLVYISPFLLHSHLNAFWMICIFHNHCKDFFIVAWVQWITKKTLLMTWVRKRNVHFGKHFLYTSYEVLIFAFGK